MESVIDFTNDETTTHEEYIAEQAAQFAHLVSDIDNAKILITTIENDLRSLKEITDDASITVEKLKLIQEHTTCELDDDGEEEPPVEEEDPDDEEPSVDEEEPPADDNPTPEVPDIDDEGEPEVPVQPLPETNKIKYAPVIKPVKGNYSLCCISLIWQDNPGAPINKVRRMGNDVAQVYNALSGGNVKFKVDAKAIKVNYLHQAKNLGKAEAAAKKIAIQQNKGKKYDLYAIVHNRVRNYSNAGGDTAHLYGTLTRDALHEIGHTRLFRLGHAGKYVGNKYESYGDGTSFMSRFPSQALNAPQLYFLGWIPQKQAALHLQSDPAMDYAMELVTVKKDSDYLKTVLIPREGRDLYLSSCLIDKKKLFALHLAQNGGSSRVAVFANKAEYDNLVFQKVSSNPESLTIRVSPKMGPSR